MYVVLISTNVGVNQHAPKAFSVEHLALKACYL